MSIPKQHLCTDSMEPDEIESDQEMEIDNQEMETVNSDYQQSLEFAGQEQRAACSNGWDFTDISINTDFDKSDEQSCNDNPLKKLVIKAVLHALKKTVGCILELSKISWIMVKKTCGMMYSHF
jgi:hypothetical protein